MTDGSAALVAERVTMRFGGLVAVSQVSFILQRAAVTAMIGPNGAGKTTTFNMISGLLTPSDGRIRSLGLARTFQNVQLFANLNALENVMACRYCRTRSSFLDALLYLPRDRAERHRMRAAADELLEWVGIREKRFLMPSELPYGDQRRLEIARALATEPKLIMLDEPSAGMVPAEARGLMELIGKLKQRGLTIFLIEHNMNVVMSI
ncbi:MAG: ABC transporter ATP-binding protein, partial [Cyanobacteria bacterium 13_1_40CM_2_61_4]